MARMERRKPAAARPGVLGLLAAALPGLALPAQAQKRREEEPKAQAPARVAPFLGDFESARKSSLERNAPLVFVAILEGEEASDRFRNQVYKGEEFARATAGAVVVLVNDGKHATKKIQVVTEAGETVEREVCAVYEMPTCTDHKRNMNRFFQEYHVGGDKEAMKMPHFLVVLPDGKIQGRLADEIQKSAALKLVADAQAAAGPSITAEQLQVVQAELASMRAHEGSLAWIEAWKASARVLAIATAGVHSQAARAGAERAVAALRVELADAVGLLEQGKVEDGYPLLRKLAQGLEGTPLAEEGADALKKAERDKRFKDAIAEILRREEADKLWEECLAALAEDKVPQAERLAAHILKRYAGTPAAAKAAERFPALAGGQ